MDRKGEKFRLDAGNQVSEKEPSKQTLWYVKSKEKMEGPFPSGAIRRSLLLGRFVPNDQVSVDKISWDRIVNTPEVMPPEMRPALQEGAPELLAARLREDQRSGLDRRTSSDGRLPHGDRRKAEPVLIERHREAKRTLLQLGRETETPVAGIAVIGLLALLAIGYGLYLGGPERVSDPDCSSPPVPAVDWHNCRLDNLVADSVDLADANLGNASFRSGRFVGARFNRADLRYSDLSGSDLSYAEFMDANMKGTRLQNTDLSYADLRRADLRYADLTGANLGGSILSGAMLDYAIWEDGRKCRQGSIGHCLGPP